MNKCLMVVATLSVMLAAVADARLNAELGKVRLHGPVGDRLQAMIRNHVEAKDVDYLTECFKDRTEQSLWHTEFWGKYMHGAVPLYQLSESLSLKTKIERSSKAVMGCQDADGYIGNYSPEKRFAKGTWDVWGCKYVMMGLLHYYDMSGDKKSLDACKRLCDYVFSKVGPGSSSAIGGTGCYAGMPSCSILEPVMWLYRRSGDRQCLAFADFIVKEMTEREDGPRLLDLALKGVPVSERTKLKAGSRSVWDYIPINRGKAYEMMSCYQGLLEYFEVTGRHELLDAAVASAQNIIAEEINLAGGAASFEHWYRGRFHQHETFAHTQETCVTITWMRLCEKLLAITGDVRYADEFEKSFYNAYLAALNRSCDRFAAYTPLLGARSEGNVHCYMHTNCCNENGPRGFVAMLRSFLQAEGDEVFLNWFNSAHASIVVPSTGKSAQFEFYTEYPREGHVDIFVRNAEPMRFKLSIRIPGWSKGTRMTLNGASITDGALVAGGYFTQDRTWRQGDHVEIDFDLPVVMHRLDGCVAFTRGPVLLARDTRFGDGDLSEYVRNVVYQEDFAKTFELGRSADPAIWITLGGRLPLGAHGENPNLQKTANVHMCDYASAANRWDAMNICRCWFNVEKDPIEVLAPSEEKTVEKECGEGCEDKGGEL